MRRVVVTGLGMINSVGHDKESAFKAMCEGKCGIDTITLFDPEKYSVKIAGEVKDFDPTTVMDAKEVKKADRFIQLGLKAAQEAIEDASLPEDINKERFGISAASGIGGLPAIEKNSIIIETRGPRRISPFFIPSALVNMLGGFVSIAHGLKGPNLSSVTACAAGTHGISEACKTIMLGGADAMLVIAAESAITGAGIGGFAAMKALSTRNDDPQHASRPFDADRDGFIMGEGAGALILEEYENAVKRGAKIYAEIIGFGESGDAYHISTPQPESRGAIAAMQDAYEMADKPHIDYINAHGTSTYYNDVREAKAIDTVFGDMKPFVSSIKGQIGHTLGAAGAIEAVVSILAIKNNSLPPVTNYNASEDDMEVLNLITEPLSNREVTTALSCNFGFGGTNAAIIFQEYLSP